MYSGTLESRLVFNLVSFYYHGIAVRIPKYSRKGMVWLMHRAVHFSSFYVSYKLSSSSSFFFFFFASKIAS